MTRSVVTVNSGADPEKLNDIFEQYDYIISRSRMGEDDRNNRQSTSDIMHTATIFVSPEDDISKAADHVVEFKLRSIPVMENGQLKGIMSRQDIIRCLMIVRPWTSSF